jgi:hypothetical protein
MRSSLHNLRQTVAALRAALLVSSIEAMDAQMPALQHAAATLESLQSEALRRSEGPQSEAPRPEELKPNLMNKDPLESESRRELEAVSKDLRASAALIAQGLAITQGMARLLAPAAGYRHDGEPAPLNTAGTLEIRG